ncbi:MAG: glutamine-hydrolyzing GMP synthase, partial [Bdellovibrionales bacterium RIFOXYD1_FULL_53_11]
IARRVREAGVFSRIVPADAGTDRIRSLEPCAIILSGGPSSVYDKDAPALPAGFFEMQQSLGVAVLGICYGMQLITHQLGGSVGKAVRREYGRMNVRPDGASALFPSMAAGGFQAWMSHGDEIKKLPPGFVQTARSASGAVAAIENGGKKIFAVQFHPEVTHTEGGRELLRHFLLGIAGLRPDWSMKSFMEEKIREIAGRAGPEAHMICGLSGGVDSTVAATLVHRAIGGRLHCVFVDNGLLRWNERERVMDTYARELRLPVTCFDAADRFLARLAGITDPEAKRKAIGDEFIKVFDEASRAVARDTGAQPGFLVQGTLYPDVIESSPPPGAAGELGDGRVNSSTIKSHHNVGGLPRDLGFKLIEPLRELFKDEVRELGRELGIAPGFVGRHPFPGPGLAVRILGEVTRERLEILRMVDEIFIQAIRDAGLYDCIWQAFAVFLPLRSVGVQGDGRTHEHVVALRAVSSIDGMTADWYRFEPDFLARVSARICNEVKQVGRVVYDVSSKPPATIEWE